ncbi:disease resistance At4g27190-like [Olea europaea subsp. europaea]|uniref:Disease resistance At4g27190-like n=1 Tax=Olea europaea subsp. europaea TaxID=158383 RepID=A0A8S0Q0C3_OLEEU|nr:disease resistance At4g27190-like [Olea europaea subsp. europaea]
MRCLFLRYPNLKTHYLLSRNATKKITVIAELQEESKFDVVGIRAPLKLMSFYGSKALKTRISTKKKIIEDLEDTGIEIVGICGLPGISKTIMAQEVMTQVLKDKLFDEVAMVVVSKDVDIIRIQDKLAEMHEISKISNELNDIAKQIAERCKGLPLALEVVSKTLRNSEVHIWRDALNQMRHCQHSDVINSSIELSYDYLESNEHRSFLLLRSVFPEDKSIPIESLVMR